MGIQTQVLMLAQQTLEGGTERVVFDTKHRGNHSNAVH